jgi:hypothetical protein
MEFGVMLTPGLAIAGPGKFSGKVPAGEDMKKLLA